MRNNKQSGQMQENSSIIADFLPFLQQTFIAINEIIQFDKTFLMIKFFS